MYVNQDHNINTIVNYWCTAFCALLVIESLLGQTESGESLPERGVVNNTNAWRMDLIHREKLDRLEDKYEQLYLGGNDLLSFAEDAVKAKDLSSYYLIQKTSLSTTEESVHKTIAAFKQKNIESDDASSLSGDDMGAWLRELAEAYPEDGYLEYIRCLFLYAEGREGDANRLALQALQRLDNADGLFSIPPDFTNVENIEEKRLLYRDAKAKIERIGVLYAGFLCTHLLLNGYSEQVGVAMSKMDGLVRKISPKSETPFKALRGLMAVVQNDNKQVEQILQDPLTSAKEFIGACDFLLPVKTETVLKIAELRTAENPEDANLRLNLVKLLWRTGRVTEAEKNYNTLLAARNIQAFQWLQRAQSYQPGSSDEVNPSALVKLRGPLGQGSGFYISPDGLVATAAHNLAASQVSMERLLVIDHEGREWKIEKVFIHPFADLAVLKTQKKGSLFLKISSEGWKPDERVVLAGFPGSSLVPFHRRPQILGNVEGGYDLLLSGQSMSGTSGSPIVKNGKVLAVHASTQGAWLAEPLLDMVEQIKSLPDKQTQALFIKENDQNPFLDPTFIFLPLFSGIELEKEPIPESFEKKLSLSAYLQRKMAKKLKFDLASKKSTFSIMIDRLRNSDPRNRKSWLHLQKLSPHFVAFFEAAMLCNPQTSTPDQINREMEKLSVEFPKLSTSVGYVAFFNLLKAFDSVSRYTVVAKENPDELRYFKIGGEKVSDPVALRKSLSFMEKYWSLDPDLRLDSSYGSFVAGPEVEAVLNQWPFLKTKLAVMLADSEGKLNDQALNEFVAEGNPMAMAIMAQKLSKTDEKIRGFSYALRSAEAGEPAGQAVLARYFLAGIGTIKNEAKGFEWAQKSAQGDHPQGCLFAGVCLVQGIGVAKDPARGFRLIQRAAIGGDEEARQILANPKLAEQGRF